MAVESGLLGCDAVSLGETSLAFRRNVVHNNPPKRR